MILLFKNSFANILKKLHIIVMKSMGKINFVLNLWNKIMNLVCFAYSASAIFLFLIDSLTIIIFLISEFDNEDIYFIISISSLENDFIKSIISSLSFPDNSCINTLHFP